MPCCFLSWCEVCTVGVPGLPDDHGHTHAGGTVVVVADGALTAGGYRVKVELDRYDNEDPDGPDDGQTRVYLAAGNGAGVFGEGVLLTPRAAVELGEVLADLGRRALAVGEPVSPARLAVAA